MPALEIPRMGLASHLQGVINGIFLILLGVIWPAFELPSKASSALFWLAVYGTFANWAATFLAAFWGAGRSMPLAAEGRVGIPLHEGIIDGLLISVSLVMLGVCVLALWGLRRKVLRRSRSRA